MDDLFSRLEDFRSSVQRREIENETLQKQIESHIVFKDTAIYQVNLSTYAAEFVDKVASITRGSAKSQFESLVTAALKQVYDDAYSFHLEWSFKRNRPALEFFVQHGTVLRPLDGFGGGVSDLVAVVLRILVASLIPRSPRLLILDEPSKHLDDERSVRFGEFLALLCERLHWQIICVTHSQQVAEAAAVVYQVSHDGTHSIVSGPDRVAASGHLRELHLQRFESHLKSSLAFASTLTAIVGPSNVGKTAVLRALRLVALGEWAPEQRSFQEGITKVQLCTSNGIIEVRKSDKLNVWSIDGVEFKNVGRSVPPQAVAVHGIAPVTIGGVSVPIHFSSQLESHFLLYSLGSENATSSLAAKVLDSLTGLDGVDELSQRLALYRTRNQAEVRNREQLADELRSQQHDEEQLKLDAERLERANSFRDQMVATEKRSESIFQWQTDLKQYEYELLDIEARVRAIPSTTKASELLMKWLNCYKWCGHIRTIADDLAACEVRHENIKKRLAAIPDLATAQRIFHEFSANSVHLSKIGPLRQRFLQYTDQLAVINVKIAKLPETAILLKKFSSWVASEKRLLSVGVIRKQYSAVMQQQLHLQTKIEATSNQYQRATMLMQKWLEEVGTCPTCGQSFAESPILAGLEHEHFV